jgi:hypothetical protein
MIDSVAMSSMTLRLSEHCFVQGIALPGRERDV